MTNMSSNMKIGIYSVSSQSGRAFFAEMITSGYEVYGYARESEHGREFVDTVRRNGGLVLDRPENKNNEIKTFLPLTDRANVGHSLDELIASSDVIILALPSNYLQETSRVLKNAGVLNKRTPLILSSSRSFATPYMWSELGHMYPIVAFSTCPYSCKAPNSGTVYIKRRKRTWYASFEGSFSQRQFEAIKTLFPQVVFNTAPYTTTIGNIGAVFHPGTYLLNYNAIQRAKAEGKEFSFYIEGIYKRPEVGEHLEKIDQVRLQIADKLGAVTYGLASYENEDKWSELTAVLYDEQINATTDITALRKIRHDCLRSIGDTVPSAQHWLDYTYGVQRIIGEPLSEAIGRTPTYQKMSVPQSRYVTEDIPSSLVPLSAFAKRLDVDAAPIDEIIGLYEKHYGNNHMGEWRDLHEYSTEYLIDYLQGRYFEIIDNESRI